MKKILIFSITLFLISCGSNTPSTATKKNTSPEVYAKSITEKDLKKHLYTYASDAFEGRETGEKGQLLAINYLKKQYQDLGISSPIPTYFQEVPLMIAKAPEVSLTINGETGTNKEHFTTFSQAKSAKIPISEIRYIGYGIDAENYSDYTNNNVKNKFVLIKIGEPKNTNGTYTISGTKEVSEWSNFSEAIKLKIAAAKKYGAKGVFFYMDTDFSKIQNYAKNVYRRSMKLAKKEEIYTLFIDNTFAKKIVNNINSTTKHQNIKTDIVFDYKNTSKNIVSQNVLAHVKGSEKPNEYIVISAHLDHLGMRDGKIYNGADDDGSGTVAVLEIAQAFKKATENGNTPKRSILFLHVTGEEKGLLGSKHYTDNDPIIPLKNTVANLNIDMIGRIDPKRTEGNRNYLYLIGADKLSSELHTISEEVNNKYCNIEFDYTFNDENDPNRFYYRSDHYNFAKNNIPVIFYFNGTHDDYHKESDTVDKIEYDLLENRARLIFYTAWELANRKDRIIVDKAIE